jgi:Cu(I)/Ag(I) efflux system periplasmic protein CusF
MTGDTQSNWRFMMMIHPATRLASFVAMAAFSLAAAAGSHLTDGEVRKVDKDTGKLTLKHGVIKNLDMPAMTMVFQVRDKAMLDKLQTGDKVKFNVVNEDGKFTVTEIEKSK